MIDVKQAVEAAANYVGDLFAGEKILDVRLEEVELSEGDDFWNVTLSFLREPKAASEFSKLVPARMQREYKMFVIRSLDGQVKSMKIRQLA